jgi:hypothetical protein
MVAALHPAWEKVKPEHRPLHTRNMAQILQDQLTNPTRFLVCWAEPKGVSVDGGTRSAYELNRIVHGMERTHNLATPAGQRGFAAELRQMAVPIERGTWYPRETMSLKQHAQRLLEEGHGRIGIAIPVGVAGTHTHAERLNVGPNYTAALELAKSSASPSIIGDAWENRIVLIAVPSIQRDSRDRTAMIEELSRLAKSNALARLIVPHEDIEPNRDIYKDVERIVGLDDINDSPFTFATIPDAQRGLARDTAQTGARGNDRSAARTNKADQNMAASR